MYCEFILVAEVPVFSIKQEVPRYRVEYIGPDIVPEDEDPLVIWVIRSLLVMWWVINDAPKNCWAFWCHRAFRLVEY